MLETLARLEEAKTEVTLLLQETILKTASNQPLHTLASL
jgi:hypothetical protein